VAWAWLEQSLSPAQVLGGLVILAGVGIALRVGSDVSAAPKSAVP
jgi:drug/metabolite transporter (DMT)-like permease